MTAMGSESEKSVPSTSCTMITFCAVDVAVAVATISLVCCSVCVCCGGGGDDAFLEHLGVSYMQRVADNQYSIDGQQAAVSSGVECSACRNEEPQGRKLAALIQFT